jgi:hypothetical protein
LPLRKKIAKDRKYFIKPPYIKNGYLVEIGCGEICLWRNTFSTKYASRNMPSAKKAARNTASQKYACGEIGFAKYFNFISPSEEKEYFYRISNVFPFYFSE